MTARLDMADMRDVIPDMMFLRFVSSFYSILSIGLRETIGGLRNERGRSV